MLTTLRLSSHSSSRATCWAFLPSLRRHHLSPSLSLAAHKENRRSYQSFSAYEADEQYLEYPADWKRQEQEYEEALLQHKPISEDYTENNKSRPSQKEKLVHARSPLAHLAGPHDMDSTHDSVTNEFSRHQERTNFPGMATPTQEADNHFQGVAPVDFPDVPNAANMAGTSDISPQDEMANLDQTMERLQNEIYAKHGQTFNLNSYKQVSLALFGIPTESTSKASLEAVAVKHPWAQLLLDYRQAKQRSSKLRKQVENGGPHKVPSVVATSSKPIILQKNDLPRLEAQDPLWLLDTSSFIFRAYHSMPPMHRQDGTPTGAVLGFCNMLNRLVLDPLLQGRQPRLVLCCDARKATHRHDRYSDYKANRPSLPMDLLPQFELIRQAANAYGMTWMEAPGYEADDIIASLSNKGREEDLMVCILSGDKDLMQLVTPNPSEATTLDSPHEGGTVEMIDPMTMTKWSYDRVVDKWGVPPEKLRDVLALAGDSADNIPGVPGVGPKFAARLIQDFGTLDNLLDNLDQVKQPKRRENLQKYQDQARLSQELVQLVSDLDWKDLTIREWTTEEDYDSRNAVPESAAELRMEPIHGQRLLDFYDEMGFITIKQRVMQRLQKAGIEVDGSRLGWGAPRKRSSPAKPKTTIPNPQDYEEVPF